MFNLKNTRFSLESSEISLFLDIVIVTLKKKLYFDDLVKLVNDQFNKKNPA